ncbi:MAG: YwqJ-related putative deaminase [Candidatus Sericytochromatia bacterium]
MTTIQSNPQLRYLEQPLQQKVATKPQVQAALEEAARTAGHEITLSNGTSTSTVALSAFLAEPEKFKQYSQGLLTLELKDGSSLVLEVSKLSKDALVGVLDTALQKLNIDQAVSFHRDAKSIVSKMRGEVAASLGITATLGQEKAAPLLALAKSQSWDRADKLKTLLAGYSPAELKAVLKDPSLPPAFKAEVLDCVLAKTDYGRQSATWMPVALEALQDKRPEFLNLAIKTFKDNSLAFHGNPKDAAVLRRAIIEALPVLTGEALTGGFDILNEPFVRDDFAPAAIPALLKELGRFPAGMTERAQVVQYIGSLGSAEQLLAAGQQLKNSADKDDIQALLDSLSTKRDLKPATKAAFRELLFHFLQTRKDPELAPKLSSWLERLGLEAGQKQQLQDITRSTTLPTLRRQLSDPDPYIRRDAIASLVELKDRDPGTIRQLLSMAQTDGDFQVRSVAIGALGKLGDQSVILPLLQICATDKEAYQRGNAQSALHDLKDLPEFPGKVLEYFKDYDPKAPHTEAMDTAYRVITHMADKGARYYGGTPEFRAETMLGLRDALKQGNVAAANTLLEGLRPQELKAVLQTFHKEILAGPATDIQKVLKLIETPTAQIGTPQFNAIKDQLGAYNKYNLHQVLPLSQQQQIKLQTLFIREAAKLPEGPQRAALISMAPDLSEADVRLYKARGSLTEIADIKAAGHDLAALPPEAQAQLKARLNSFLKMSGLSQQLSDLSPASVDAAIKALEKAFDLPQTGALTLENLRKIEVAQKDAYQIITNVRNILHDEVLAGSPKPAAELEKLVGKGEKINAAEALRQVQVLRQKYRVGLGETGTPAKLPKLADAYAEMMQARSTWITTSKQAQARKEIFSADDLGQLLGLMDKLGKDPLTYQDLKTIAASPERSIKERAAAQKLLDNPNLYDYIWSIDVGDANQNAQLDGQNHPFTATVGSFTFGVDRPDTSISRANLERFQTEVLSRESLINGPHGREDQAVAIPQFYDGREAALKIFDATKVSGDELFSFLGEGWGTNEGVVIGTLKDSAEAQGKLNALKRDYYRIYGEELRTNIEGELSGGDEGEALYYHDSPALDAVALRKVGSGAQAEILLTRFKPMIDQIGADNGLLAWVSGHDSADGNRQDELYALAGKAQKALAAWKAEKDPTKKAALEKDLVTQTGRMLMRLEADAAADAGYARAKAEALAVVKGVAVAVVATVATVATAGAGAPVMVALAAGTAGGAAVAGGGEILTQIGDNLGEQTRHRIDTQIAEDQKTALTALNAEDEALKEEALAQIELTRKALEARGADLSVFKLDWDKIAEATFEGAKTGFVVSLTTLATMGLGQLVNTGEAISGLPALARAGAYGRQALAQGLASSTGELAGALLQPIHLKTAGGAQAVLARLERMVTDQQEMLGALKTEKQAAQERIASFLGAYQDQQPATKGISEVKTVNMQPPSRAEVEQFLKDQLLVKDIDANIGELETSIRETKADISRMRERVARGTGLEWDSKEWAQIKGSLARNLAISFLAGALLNQLQPKGNWTRIASNLATGGAEQFMRNAADKYFGDNPNKDLLDGVAVSMVSSLLQGEVSHKLHERIRANRPEQQLRRALETELARTDSPLSADTKSKLTKAHELLTRKPANDQEFLQNLGEAYKILRQIKGSQAALIGDLRKVVQQSQKDLVTETARLIAGRTKTPEEAEIVIRRIWASQEAIYRLEGQQDRLKAKVAASPNDQVLKRELEMVSTELVTQRKHMRDLFNGKLEGPAGRVTPPADPKSRQQTLQPDLARLPAEIEIGRGLAAVEVETHAKDLFRQMARAQGMTVTEQPDGSLKAIREEGGGKGKLTATLRACPDGVVIDTKIAKFGKTPPREQSSRISTGAPDLVAGKPPGAYKGQLLELAQSRLNSMNDETSVHYQNKTERGPVLAVLVDRKTGAVYFGQNDGMPRKLHPLLEKRMQAYEADLTAHPEKRSLKEGLGRPGEHAETRALNDALWARDPQGKLTDIDLADFEFANIRLTGTADAGKQIECCSNCSVMTKGAGQLSGTKSVADENTEVQSRK